MAIALSVEFLNVIWSRSGFPGSIISVRRLGVEIWVISLSIARIIDVCQLTSVSLKICYELRDVEGMPQERVARPIVINAARGFPDRQVMIGV